MTGSWRFILPLFLVTCLLPAGIRGIPAPAPGAVRMGPPAPPARSTAFPTPTRGAALAPYSFSPRWDNKQQGVFVLSLCRDLRGCTWVGTAAYPKPDDGGVWRYDPAAPEDRRWTRFTVQNGLVDNNGYAFATDALNRTWVGSLNHGVSVFNGEVWKNYDILTGPSGSRVFAIATCPTDHDVWIATESGLTRYSLRKDTWSYYNRPQLPSDQTNALAFNKVGDLFMGTQCDGIAIGRAADGYRRWTMVKGPDQAPNTPGGSGLPTNLINSLAVSPGTGTVYAGTTTGLARSEDNGRTWRYLRGADWRSKVLGLYHGPKPGDFDTHGHILQEDDIQSVSAGDDGILWIGYRWMGYDAIDELSGRVLKSGNVGRVRSILPSGHLGALVGRYGAGVQVIPWAAVRGVNGPGPAVAPVTSPAPLPHPAAPPTDTDLEAFLPRSGSASDKVDMPVYFGEDC